MAPDSMVSISDPKIDGQGIAIWKEKKNWLCQEKNKDDKERGL
jgi:hypothetical protein